MEPDELVRRPMLLPALVHAWRGHDRLQLGVGNPAPVVLAGVDRNDARFLLDLDGRRTRVEALAHAATLGLTPSRAERLLQLLDEGHCLGDGATDARPVADLSEPDRARLAPDLAALSLLPPTRSMGLSLLARRRTAHVEVLGAGRVGAAVVSLLAAAGVGTVSVVDDGAVRLCDVAPLGPAPEAVGRTRSDAAVAAARRTTPGVRRDSDSDPQLVVIASGSVVDPATADALVAAGTPHLPVTVLETTATVGPLVTPGDGPCLRCIDLHRVDRDSEWPLVAAQVDPVPSLTDTRVDACDVVLATAAAALASLMVLAHLTGSRPGDRSEDHPQPPALDGWDPGTAYVLRLPSGHPRRRTYPPHPRCGCSWGATMSG